MDNNKKNKPTNNIIPNQNKSSNPIINLKNNNANANANANANTNTNTNNEITNYQPSSKLNSSQVEHDDLEEYSKDALQKALNDASESASDVMPNSSESRGKKGWCFIGAEKENRTCAEIGINDVCMSGDIYPTKDVCINPRLRA